MFPTIAAVPDPKNATGGMAGAPSEWDAEGRGRRRREPSERAGLMIVKCAFPRSHPPPNGGGAATRDDRLASIRSKGWTRNNGTHGPAGLGDEYVLSILSYHDSYEYSFD